MTGVVGTREGVVLSVLAVEFVPKLTISRYRCHEELLVLTNCSTDASKIKMMKKKYIGKRFMKRGL